MEYKILEQNGVENENVDGAAFNNFTAGGRNGVVKGILNECEVYSPSSNIIEMKTGELIVQGFRVKITSPYTISLSGSPAVPILYQIVAKIVLSADRSVAFSLEYREEGGNVVQEDLYQAERGAYEVVVARFTHSPSGVSNIVKNLSTIIAGTGGGGATFVPVVSSDGILSWINDKGLPNPDPVYIIGPRGEKGNNAKIRIVRLI